MSRYLSFFTTLVVSFFLFLVSAFSQDLTSRYDVDTGQFTLDATAFVSDGEGPLGYSWTLVSGPPGSSSFIVSPNDPITGFAADISGTYLVELQIVDNGVPRTPLQLNLSTDASTPEAGFDVVGLTSIGSDVHLDAVSSYHPDGLSLAYDWQIVSAPVGSAASIENAAIGSAGFARNFTPDVEGDYEIALTVSDLTGASDTVSRTFTTGRVLPVANAGSDRSIEVGASILLDPFETTFPNADGSAEGTELSANWSILHRPVGSAVELADTTEGRQPFTADVSGLYVLQLAVSGRDGSDRDTVVISVGDTSATNVAPVARIDALLADGSLVATGPAISQEVVAGEAITLSGSASSDEDGDLLTYQWGLVSVPEGSAPSISANTGPQVSFTTDLAGDYIVSLNVTDGTLSSVTTFLLSSSSTAPIANAGADIVLPEDRVITVDASGSLIGDPASANYLWSVPGLGSAGAADSAAIDAQTSLQTAITFDTAGSGVIDNPAGALEDYDLIVFDNANSRSQSLGRTFIGGNLNGQSSDYGNNLGGNVTGEVILTVGGNINGNPKNINNGGSVRVGGRANARLNLNGGGSLINDPAVSITTVRNQMKAFSSFLNGLPETGSINLPGNQPSGVTLNAVPGDDGVAVFSIDNGNTLFNNNKVQSIDINLNGAEAVIINVGGNNIKLSKANFVGNANSENVRSRVLWNFHEAVNIRTTRHLSGSLLAPNAQLQNRSPIFGAAVVRNINHRAAIGAPGFAGSNAFADIPDPIDVALVQVEVTDANGSDVDTVLATNGNIAPVAAITTSANTADVGSSLTLQANTSTDANADPLTYRWSLLSRPEASATELVIDASGQTSSIIPDTRGAYVTQLIASDGALESNPATIIVFGNNQSPQITSLPSTEAVVGVEYTYQAAASDADGDVLEWELVSAPQGAGINPTTGLVTFTPTTPGTQTIEIAVTDGFGGRDTQSYSIEVEDPRNLFPPTISAPDTITVRPGELVSFTVTGDDPEGEAISFQALPLPNGAQFDTQTGEFVFIAGNELGINNIDFFATDGVLTASTSSIIEVVSWPDTDPTRFSGRVLDAVDFANGIETPVEGATATIAGLTVITDSVGNFTFVDLGIDGANIIEINGSNATAVDGSVYGAASESRFIYENGENVLTTPILLARLGEDEVQLTDVNDILPPELRSCRIQRIDALAGGSVLLSTVPLQAFDPLAPGSTAVVWSRGSLNTSYAIVGEGTVGADGITLEGVNGSVAAGSNLVVTALPVTTQDSALQARSRLHPTVLGEGNLQTSFSLPSYSTLGQQRAPSFIYNSTAADPRPIITTNVELPANSTLTQNLQVEVFVNGQRMPGVGVIDIRRSDIDGTTVPVQGTTATTSISVAFNATSIPTGVHPYEVLVFAEHECAAAAAKAEGELFINNRSESVYGAGWKPSELQTLIELPDGSVAIEEPDGTISNFNNAESASIVTEPVLFDIIDPERAESGDIDNDGDNDILVVEGATGDILIIENLGLNTRQFQVRERFDAGSNGRRSSGNEFLPDTNDIAIADFNNDGIMDFATSHQFDNVGRVFLGQGDNTFERVQFSTGRSASVVAADFNNDGFTDAAFSQQNDVFVVFGPISDASQTREINAFGIRIFDLDVGDLNNDGITDLFMAGSTDRQAQISFGGDDFGISRPITFPVPQAILNSGLQQYLSIGDIDGDGINEVAIAGSSNAMVFRQNENGEYVIALNTPLPNGGNIESLTLRDIQGDGFADLIVVNKTAVVYIYEREAIFGSAEPVEILIPGSGDDTINVSDFDGDGFQDLVLFYASGVRGVPDNVAVHFGLGEETSNFIRPFGDFTDLVRNDDGGFSRRYKDGTVVTFNASGQQTSIADTNGNVTAYTYDENGGVSSITDPTGEITNYTYENGLLASIITPDGRTNTFEYDAEGNLINANQPNISLPQTVIGPDGREIIVSNDNYPARAYRTDNATISFSYDANGRIIGQVDERGFQTTNTYGAAGRLTNSQLPDGGNVRLDIAKTLGLSEFGVDLDAPVEGTFVAPEDRVTRLEDARGNAAAKRVNEFGAVVETFDPVGRTTLFERDDNNLVTRIDAPSSSTPDGRLFTELAYDAQGNVTQKREAVGTPNERAMLYEYEPEFSQITRMVDYEGFEWNHTYDDRANRLTTINPDGTIMSYTYNDEGQVLTKVDERGNVMTYAYDELGRQITMLDERGIEMTYTRDGSGNPSVVVEANGQPEAQATINLFDERNRKIVGINGEDEVMQYSYDNFGNQRVTTDATGVEADKVFDEKSRVASVVDPASGTTTIDYDLTDNITQVVESDGTISTMVYDEVNRISETTDGINVTRRYVYDLRDNIIAVTDGRGNTTTFAYDELDRLIARTNQLGNVWSFEYDLRDLRTATIKPDGTRIEFTYDNRSRLTSYGAVGNAESTRSFTYDEEDNLVSATAAAGTDKEIAHTFTYDERDQLSQAALAAGPLGGAFSFDYEYDALQRRSTMRDSAGGVTRYTYDRANRLVSIEVPSGRIVDITYDDASRRSNVAMPNGLNARATFQTPVSTGNTTGLLASIEHGLNNAGATGSSLNQLLGTFSYDYNQKANITAINESGSVARQRNYTLDPIERLTNVADGSGTSIENYTLDSEGNRITSHLASFHVTNPANRVTEDEFFQFESDVNGNLVRKTEKATGETWVYEYSVYDELTRATRQSGLDAATVQNSIAYIYDAMGRRHTERKLDAANTLTGGANFRYDGQHLAVEQILDATGTISDVRWYSHSDYTDDLVSLTPSVGDTGAVSSNTTATGVLAPSADAFYYHTDHQGSVRAITDEAGNVVNEYAYDSYGNAEVAVEAVLQRFRYTARFFDAETGLYYYRARHYDAGTGRFNQEDPIWFAAGDLNVHRYVWNNPVNWNDPSGLSGIEYGALARNATANIVRQATIGNRLSCLFSVAAGVLSVANTAHAEGASLVGITTYTVAAGDIALECGARAIAKKVRIGTCKQRQIVKFALKTALTAANLNILLGQSFDGETLVSTPDGYVAIKDIKVGDEVIAIDEITGEEVTRKVVERYSREAPGTTTLEVEDAEGNRDTFITTPEHPFHVEGWDGKTTESLIAELGGVNSVEPHKLFPSVEDTKFGDWVKAGALKAGDQISIRGGVDKVSGDQTVTIKSITQDNTPHRVYNLEIESRDGEITHNYFVGEDELWVHNGRNIFVKFPSRKKAKDARPRAKPIPAGLTGDQRKKRKRRGCSNKPDKHTNNKDDPPHFHDDNHNNPTKPNIHYKF